MVEISPNVAPHPDVHDFLTKQALTFKRLLSGLAARNVLSCSGIRFIMLLASIHWYTYDSETQRVCPGGWLRCRSTPASGLVSAGSLLVRGE
jgi:hypothetical protein